MVWPAVRKNGEWLIYLLVWPRTDFAMVTSWADYGLSLPRCAMEMGGFAKGVGYELGWSSFGLTKG